jgi:hypothetical protein
MDFKSPMSSASMSSCYAQAVHRHEVEMEIKFGKVEDFDRQFTTRRIRGAQAVGFPLDTFLGIVWRFESTRVVQGSL